MTTPTPRTDAVLIDAPELNHPHPELIELARQLERDLAAAQAELASVKAHAEAMYRSIYCGRNEDEEFAADAYRAAHPETP